MSSNLQLVNIFQGLSCPPASRQKEQPDNQPINEPTSQPIGQSTNQTNRRRLVTTNFPTLLFNLSTRFCNCSLSSSMFPISYHITSRHHSTTSTNITSSSCYALTLRISSVEKPDDLNWSTVLCVSLNCSINSSYYVTQRDTYNHNTTHRRSETISYVLRKILRKMQNPRENRAVWGSSVM